MMDIVWEPVGKMLLVLKDDDIEKTSGGIILPEDNKIPTLTCRVLSVGPQVDTTLFPVNLIGSRILVCPKSAVPVSYENINKRFLVHSDNILAIAESTSKAKKSRKMVDEQ